MRDEAWSFISLVVLAVLLVVSIVFTGTDRAERARMFVADCSRRGGITMVAYNGYECLSPAVRIPGVR